MAASSAPMPSLDSAVQSEASDLEVELDFLRHTVYIVGLDLPCFSDYKIHFLTPAPNLGGKGRCVL